MPRFLLALLALLLFAPALQAQTDGETRRVVLVNGDVYVGTVVDEDADPVVIRTTDGVERTFRRADVALVAPLIKGRFFRTDPVRTRFFLAPTARTLGGGEFRGDLTYVYPSVTAGISDRVDFLASGFVTLGAGSGDSGIVTPLVGLKGQVYAGERAQVALGLSTVVALGDDASFGAIPYAVATFGDEVQSVSVGLGGAIGGAGDGVDVAEGVVLGLGAETQVNNGVKLFVESLTAVGLGDTAEYDVATLILPGVRFFGNKFAFDVIGFLATDYESVAGFAPIGFRASYGF